MRAAAAVVRLNAEPCVSNPVGAAYVCKGYSRVIFSAKNKCAMVSRTTKVQTKFD